MCLAVPGRVLSLHEQDGTLMAQVDFGGVRKEVCLAYIPDVVVGEYVIVHVGFAIQRLDERSAQDTLANFARLGILDSEFADPFADPPTDPPTPHARVELLSPPEGLSRQQLGSRGVAESGEMGTETGTEVRA